MLAGGLCSSGSMPLGELQSIFKGLVGYCAVSCFRVVEEQESPQESPLQTDRKVTTLGQNSVEGTARDSLSTGVTRKL